MTLFSFSSLRSAGLRFWRWATPVPLTRSPPRTAAIAARGIVARQMLEGSLPVVARLDMRGVDPVHCGCAPSGDARS